MESAGFHQVRDLKKGCDNFWHGMAVKDGSQSHVALTPQGIAVACDKDSIFAIQRHIEQMGRACPEISTWKTVLNDESFNDIDQSFYAAAMSEGWSATSRS